MWLTAILPFALQALAIGVDEGYFHLRRGLPRWERIGHPLDTLTVILCMAYVLFIPFSTSALFGYIGLAGFSTFFITKDEFVHKERCPAAEMWLHAILFVLHPMALIAAGFIWPVVQGAEVAPWIARWLDNAPRLHMFLWGQFAAMSLFCLYQIIYWNLVWKAE